jgi:hypothetical protein
LEVVWFVKDLSYDKVEMKNFFIRESALYGGKNNRPGRV